LNTTFLSGSKSCFSNGKRSIFKINDKGIGAAPYWPDRPFHPLFPPPRHSNAAYVDMDALSLIWINEEKNQAAVASRKESTEKHSNEDKRCSSAKIHPFSRCFLFSQTQWERNSCRQYLLE
jgi:hypothetical protein